MDSDEEREPTQKTEKDFTIPVPERDEVLAALRKAAKASEREQG